MEHSAVKYSGRPSSFTLVVLLSLSLFWGGAAVTSWWCCFHVSSFFWEVVRSPSPLFGWSSWLVSSSFGCASAAVLLSFWAVALVWSCCLGVVLPW